MQLIDHRQQGYVHYCSYQSAMEAQIWTYIKSTQYYTLTVSNRWLKLVSNSLQPFSMKQLTWAGTGSNVVESLEEIVRVGHKASGLAYPISSTFSQSTRNNPSLLRQLLEKKKTVNCRNFWIGKACKIPYKSVASNFSTENACSSMPAQPLTLYIFLQVVTLLFMTNRRCLFDNSQKPPRILSQFLSNKVNYSVKEGTCMYSDSLQLRNLLGIRQW